MAALLRRKRTLGVHDLLTILRVVWALVGVVDLAGRSCSPTRGRHRATNTLHCTRDSQRHRSLTKKARHVTLGGIGETLRKPGQTPLDRRSADYSGGYAGDIAGRHTSQTFCHWGRRSRNSRSGNALNRTLNTASK